MDSYLNFIFVKIDKILKQYFVFKNKKINYF